MPDARLPFVPHSVQAYTLLLCQPCMNMSLCPCEPTPTWVMLDALAATAHAPLAPCRCIPSTALIYTYTHTHTCKYIHCMPANAFPHASATLHSARAYTLLAAQSPAPSPPRPPDWPRPQRLQPAAHKAQPVTPTATIPPATTPRLNLPSCHARPKPACSSAPTPSHSRCHCLRGGPPPRLPRPAASRPDGAETSSELPLHLRDPAHSSSILARPPACPRRVSPWAG